MIRNALPLAALAALTLAACSPDAVDSAAPPRLVQVETVEDRGPQTQHEFVGRVEAVRTVDIAFQVGGQLANLPVTEGLDITTGTLIAELDLADFLRAERQASVQLDQARTDYERQQTLFDRGISSAAARDAAETQYDLAVVALENAQRNLQYARLEAPFDGIVSRRLVDNYTIVAPGQPVARLQDVSELRVSIPVTEDMVATFDAEDLVRIEAGFSFLPGQRFALEPRELVSEPDAASQTYRAILALPSDIEANILPGMTATVWSEFRAPTRGASTIRIPVSAVAYNADSEPLVYVFDAETGRVVQRAIEIGAIEGDDVAVTAGLSSGEQIVTAGVSALYDGMAVRPLIDGAITG